MAEGSWPVGRRVMVEDARQDDTFLRVTWHEDSGLFVVSHWRGEVCVAATRIPATAAPDLVNVFVRGLAESAGASRALGDPAPARRETVLERLRRLLRHNAA